MWLSFSSRIHNEYFQSHLLLLDTLKHKKESEREKKTYLIYVFLLGFQDVLAKKTTLL